MGHRNHSDRGGDPDPALAAEVVYVGETAPTALAHRWSVSVASGPADALAATADGIDLVVLDVDAPNRETAAFPDRLAVRDPYCRVVLVAGERPDFDATAAGFDECVVSPTPAELRRAVERALTLSIHADAVRDYFDAVRRRERLQELGDAEGTEALQREVCERRERADRAVTGLGAADYRALFRDLGRGGPGQASSS